MKKTILVIAMSAVVIIGCVTKNPDYVAGNTNGVPQYVADPRINSISNQVSGVAGMLKPVNPYAGITDYAVNGIFGVLAIVSGLIARKKSAVADTIAAGAVKAGPTAVQTVLDHAGTTDHFAAVADLVNSNTGANQTPTGTAKPTS